MIHIRDIILETDGQIASLKPIQAEGLDEALDTLYERITASQRAKLVR